jgi:hypothetical protein
MPTKIKKIKRDSITELGDEFEVLSDSEAAETGIELANDEVLVIARPAPVQSSQSDAGSEELQTLRSRLHTVNQESAQRRITIKELTDKLNAASSRITQLEQVETTRAQEARKASAQDLFKEYVKEKGLAFVDETAEGDIRDAALSTIDWTKDVTKEALVPLIDQIVEKKKYALKSAELPRTGGGKQGNVGQGTVEIDLHEVAQAFNLPYEEPKEQ